MNGIEKKLKEEINKALGDENGHEELIKNIITIFRIEIKEGLGERIGICEGRIGKSELNRWLEYGILKVGIN